MIGIVASMPKLYQIMLVLPQFCPHLTWERVQVSELASEDLLKVMQYNLGCQRIKFLDTPKVNIPIVMPFFKFDSGLNRKIYTILKRRVLQSSFSMSGFHAFSSKIAKHLPYTLLIRKQSVGRPVNSLWGFYPKFIFSFYPKCSLNFSRIFWFGVHL